MSSTTLAVGDTDGASDTPSRMDGWQACNQACAAAGNSLPACTDSRLQVVWSKEHGRNYYWPVAQRDRTCCRFAGPSSGCQGMWLRDGLRGSGLPSWMTKAQINIAQ